MLQLDDFYHARSVLRQVLRPTALVQARKINPEMEVYLKPECLQRTGSFKVRGAYYKISQLSDTEKAKGVIACSAGNHAQGVALAATSMGVKSLICLPESAPISKIEATRRLGAEVCLVPGVYDDAHVIAGQGTIGLELIEQLPDVDAVIVPVGGGGLIAGIAFVIKQLRPHVKVYGVQAEGAPSMLKSIETHHVIALDSVSTIADGIAVKVPGRLTFATCQQYVDGIITVSEDEICAAILQLIEAEKMIAEGAGATTVAAAMFNKVPLKGKKVVCVVSGGNIDVTILNRVINRGLAKSGRLCTIDLELDDQPGKLVDVCGVVAQQGANITSVHHDRSTNRKKVNTCVLRLTMETKNQTHIDNILQALREKGFEPYVNSHLK